MDVRLARPTDAPLALALALDEGAHLVRSFGWPARNQVLRTLARTTLPLGLPGRGWIGHDGATAGLLEAAPRRYVIGWDVTRLAVRGDHPAILGPLVQAATGHICGRGVPRLFARCLSESASEELKTVGFHPLAREHVLAMGPEHDFPEEGPLPVDSRYRMPPDAWPLHQLESEITPPLVRQMEGLTSLDWSQRIRDMSEIVVEREGTVVCWIGWGVKLGRDLYQIGLLVHPDCRDAARALLLHVLKTAPVRSRFIARVRDYQHDVLEIFRDAGFEIVADEILMIKHARVEAVPLARRRIQVAKVPTAHIFNHSARYSADNTQGEP